MSGIKKLQDMGLVAKGPVQRDLDFMNDMGYTDKFGNIQYWPGQKAMNVYGTYDNPYGYSATKPLDLNYLQQQHGQLHFVTNTGTHLSGPLVFNKNNPNNVYHGGVFSLDSGVPTITYH